MSIRLRACVLLVQQNHVLLMPQIDLKSRDVTWVIPGGAVEFCESVQDAAIREFAEETGLQVRCTGLFDVTEVLQPEKPYHSVTITWMGEYLSGEIKAEHHPIYGQKTARWFPFHELPEIRYHPLQTIDKLLKTG